jgi:hypothetical protein
MPTFRLCCLTFSLLLAIGCGGENIPTAVLQSVGDLKAAIQEIIAELEEGDIAAVDAVMHRKGFKSMLDSLELLSKQPALGATGRQGVTDARERIMAELQTIHKAAPAHGGGGMEAIDVPAAKTKLNEAMALLEESLPQGWTLPAASHAHDEHAEGDHDDDEHDHDEHDHGNGDEAHDGEHDEAPSPE